MCRLYGFRSNELTKVECTLVYAQNALMAQSRADLEGKAHTDGWGIACFDDTVPEVEKRATAAYEDLHFSLTAARTFAHTVVAHVRQATVGDRMPENAHPFVCGRWAFAHNGTVRGFDAVGPQLAHETDATLLGHRLGHTDSELVFLWLLSRLAGAGLDLGAVRLDPNTVVRTIGDALRVLDDRSRAEDPTRVPKLNFLLTNGSVMVASRWNHTLHLVARDGVHDCEICGIPHVRHVEGLPYRAVVIASEPISHEEWQVVPEHAIVSVDAQIRLRTHPL